MKTRYIFIKSLREQARSVWMLILTVSMAPFFVAVYYLINEGSQPSYEVIIISQDSTMSGMNHGDILIDMSRDILRDSLDFPAKIIIKKDRYEAMALLKNGKADMMIVIPADFSRKISQWQTDPPGPDINVEFTGDLTHVQYMVAAIWANEMLKQYINYVTHQKNPLLVHENAIGITGGTDEFDLYVPGLLVISLVMLIFTASIALVTEVEHRTVIRLKMSRLKTFELLTGVSAVQLLVGLVAILLTLWVATAFGFDPSGSLCLLLLIAALTSLSIISFSLIVAAVTKTANEILIVGNFPMFLFMFFTGAAFPLEGKALVHIAGYPVSLQGLMSPTHAISALKKTLVLGLTWRDIIPELCALIILTIIYFFVGWGLFRRRHMRIT
ncbi:MAG: ABC transporter permease [Bacteroidales bacterium]|nr:ABC transporter permease [Bacteroidales bacterium]